MAAISGLEVILYFSKERMIGSAAWEALRHCPSAFAAETQGSLAEAGAISFKTSIILSLDMVDDGPGVPTGWKVA